MQIRLPKTKLKLNLPNNLSLALASLGAFLVPTVIYPNYVLSQPTLAACQPPNAEEYLLLFLTPTANNQEQLRTVLPSELKSVTCKYLDQVVTRVGGFKKVEDANRWAKYVSNVIGLASIITQVTQPMGSEPPKPNYSYNPTVLGDGFAVLVDYFRRPELANNIQKIVGGNVGLVSYGERPYLLAVYTTNQTEAYRTLQKLNENGLFAILADGKKVMLLRSVVTLK
ncbi:hypothetical protein CEP10_09325 [Cylindrospermopsis raciborskii S07]|jgi:hypothetical protein|uniref:SPOR domain-containing protein n=3 Tax=Cylindrospermopsis raciborskii TaxID=77022 RepID=A0A853MI59_9CYAN|nr:hypothetical protein [Cylindrospermopsis raciborskii]EFA68462.1 conserved hypothetical protein [Cylindrospermopsis raciborskii CS-505]MBA4445497.1 hypothetical protein [Cylindrospermopsis raciborskii CS-506_C]MBA4449732.1 hypothetical protein [Cylindrospermopsis raciborskii CS-506_D]MBA4456351.1 hypothetical protein [Cylindrospermopsis raciborskii CS-506_B]MBA4465696.1 hypothetical protein [Cylindrospermopsis raciborskii CS-506_A]